MYRRTPRILWIWMCVACMFLKTFVNAAPLSMQSHQIDKKRALDLLDEAKQMLNQKWSDSIIELSTEALTIGEKLNNEDVQAASIMLIIEYKLSKGLRKEMIEDDVHRLLKLHKLTKNTALQKDYIIGCYHWIRGVLKESLVYLDRVIVGTNEDIENFITLKLRAIDNALEVVLKYEVDMEKARSYVAIANQLSEDYELGVGFDKGLVLAINGKFNLWNNDFAKASTFMFEALPYYEKHAKVYDKVELFMLITQVLTRTGRNEESFPYLLRCVELTKQLNHSRGLFSSYANIAYGKSFYIEELPADSETRNATIIETINYAQEAIKLEKEVGKSMLSMSVRDALSRVYMDNKEYDKAMFYIKEAIDMCKGNMYHPLFELAFTRSYAKVLASMKSYKEAERHYLKSIDLSLNFKDIASLEASYRELSEVYEIIGASSKALRYFKLHTKLKDSISGVEVQNNLDAAKVKYETAKKENEILSLSQENELQQLELKNSRYFMIGSAVLFTSLLVIVFLALRSKKERIKKRLSEIELFFLQRQMDPHFISNALSAIQEHVMNSGSKSVNTYLSKFAVLFRNVLLHSRKPNVKLSDELNTARLYLDLEQFRTENQFTYTLEVDESIHQDSVYIPNMLLQPLLENAVKHGVQKNINTKGKVAVRVNKKDDAIVFEIEDNGVGIAQSKNIKKIGKHKHESVSLRILEERITLLNKNQTSKMTFRLNDKGLDNNGNSGTIVILIIPIGFKQNKAA